MKIAVLYYSKTGNTKKMAECIVEGIQSVDGINAESYSIDEVNDSQISECEAVIIGTPTYNASLSGALKMWLESFPSTYKIPGKMAGAFATAAYVHGGADLAIQTILTHLLVEGALIYSSGCAFGSPVIHLGPVAISSDLDAYRELFIVYGQRFAGEVKKVYDK